MRRKCCNKACNSALRSIQDVGPCTFRPWRNWPPLSRIAQLHNCAQRRGRTDLLLPAAACRRQCMRPMLPQICMRNERGLEHHAVCGDAHDSESRECPSGRGNPSSPNGQLPIEASGYELTWLQESATSLSVNVSMSTCLLGNIFLQLLVVALRLRFLVRLLRVTSEDVAASPPRLEAAALHALPVVELGAPADEHYVKCGLEGHTGAERSLDAVECRDRG